MDISACVNLIGSLIIASEPVTQRLNLLGPMMSSEIVISSIIGSCKIQRKWELSVLEHITTINTREHSLPCCEVIVIKMIFND